MDVGLAATYLDRAVGVIGNGCLVDVVEPDRGHRERGRVRRERLDGDVAYDDLARIDVDEALVDRGVEGLAARSLVHHVGRGEGVRVVRAVLLVEVGRRGDVPARQVVGEVRVDDRAGAVGDVGRGRDGIDVRAGAVEHTRVGRPAGRHQRSTRAGSVVVGGSVREVVGVAGGGRSHLRDHRPGATRSRRSLDRGATHRSRVGVVPGDAHAIRDALRAERCRHGWHVRQLHVRADDVGVCRLAGQGARGAPEAIDRQELDVDRRADQRGIDRHAIDRIVQAHEGRANGMGGVARPVGAAAQVGDLVFLGAGERGRLVADDFLVHHCHGDEVIGVRLRATQQLAGCVELHGRCVGGVGVGASGGERRGEVTVRCRLRGGADVVVAGPVVAQVDVGGRP